MRASGGAQACSRTWKFYELRYSGEAAGFVRGFRAIYLGLFFNCMIMAAVNLAASKIASVLLGWPMWQTLLIGAGLNIAFAATSGLWGVLVTDFIQFGIAMTGSFADAISSSPEAPGLIRRLLSKTSSGEFSGRELLDRLEHFFIENYEILPAASEALSGGRLQEIGPLVDLSQQAAERFLGNQVAETIWLARSARRLGAVAASAAASGHWLKPVVPKASAQAGKKITAPDFRRLQAAPSFSRPAPARRQSVVSGRWSVSRKQLVNVVPWLCKSVAKSFSLSQHQPPTTDY
jgi:hypothetical protein